MAGYRTFEIARPSLGYQPPQVPVVDIALVRGPFPVPGPKRPAKVRLQARRQPVPDPKPLVSPQPATLKDVENARAHPMRRLVALVSYATDTPLADFLNNKRRGPVSKARQILFWIAANHTSCSICEIGFRAGGRDHKTVTHGIRRVQAVIDRLNIQATDDPMAMAKTLWSAEWPGMH